MLKFHLIRYFIIGLNCLLLLSVSSYSADEKITGNVENNIKQDTLRYYHLRQLNIIEQRNKLKTEVPGSAHYISSDHLLNTKPIANGEVLKRVVGLNIVDEEGVGLRLNIGIRGLDPDRSRTLLVMEDGMPLALAPYGEPEMYYTPPIDRMNGVEILKGSGSILYGPQTIGGVVNFLTSEAPSDSRYNVSFAGGIEGFLRTKIGYGSSSQQFGFLSEYLRKQADNFGPTHFRINDIMTKFKIILSGRSNLYFKFGIYDESSNSTYIGITQGMFERGEYYPDLAPNDELDIRRYSASLSHNYAATDNLLINTILFGYTTSRNWLRQDFSRTPINDYAGTIWGDTTISGGAIYMKNSTAQRNRQFEVAGIEPRITYSFKLSEIKNELKGGLRFLFERAFEQLVIGNNSHSLSGQLRDDEIRTGAAFSAYLQNRLYLTENLIITPGLRFEYFNYDRKILRFKSLDTMIYATENVMAAIPGIGLNYNLSDGAAIFAGVHKGFAPPRTKDAITSSGEALNLEAEKSWNYEVGLRSEIINGLNIELTGYYLDFSNQIIPVSLSSGGLGTGLVNGGKTVHKGFEAEITANLTELVQFDYGLVLYSCLTLGNSEYSSDRFVKSGNFELNVKGNKLPYAPDFKWTGILDFSTASGLTLQLAANYTSSQFTDELNTMIASPDGQIGLIEPIFTVDFTVNYTLDLTTLKLRQAGIQILGFFVSVKNVMDSRYIASRRPQGIKVGLPRMITAGVDFNL